VPGSLRYTLEDVFRKEGEVERHGLYQKTLHGRKGENWKARKVSFSILSERVGAKGHEFRLGGFRAGLSGRGGTKNSALVESPYHDLTLVHGLPGSKFRCQSFHRG